jgi:hypothetical protein
LNEYITRCQSVLQSGVANNDLLVYWPVYDVWMMPESPNLQLTVHSIDKWLYPSPFCREVKELMKKGYSLDFVSDKLLHGLTVNNGLLTTKSGSSYKTLIIPSAKYIPVTTLTRILDLAKLGATVIFQQYPEDVPGLQKLEARRQQRQDILNFLNFRKISESTQYAELGKGRILTDSRLETALEWKKIRRETLVDSGLSYISRKTEKGVYYYLVNHTSKNINQYIPFNSNGNSSLLLDPQSGITGIPQVKQGNEQLNVRLQMAPGEALFVLIGKDITNEEPWNYLDNSPMPIEIKGPWNLKFTDGGITIPATTELTRLVSWTDLPDPASQNYSGSAIYTSSFDVSAPLSGEYLLDLGKVCESARVWVNGKEAGILWSIPFRVRITKLLKSGSNEIKIEVANLMANRIRQMDQQKVQWRNYHEINFVNIDYKPFDASNWKPMISGLLGPVTLARFQKN